MIARPPDFSTAAATASESVATTASPIWAARARRSTCTIIGNPWMSASGFPGRGGEGTRGGGKGRGGGAGAGGGHAGRDKDDGGGPVHAAALIRVARPEAKRYLSAAVWDPDGHPSNPDSRPFWDSFLR